MRRLWCTVKSAVKNMGKDEIFIMSASMAFFSMLSLAPMLVLLLTVLARLDPEMQQQIIGRLQNAMGPEAGSAIGMLMEQAGTQQVEMTFSAIAGLVTTLVGATLVLAHLQRYLNKIFAVHSKKGFIFKWLYKRFVSLLMLIGIAILLILSVIGASILAELFEGRILMYINMIVTLLLFTLLFMIMFVVLPDVRISWKDTFVGSFITAILFFVGSWGISIYLRRTSTSVYGAAGSLVILLLWIYYSGVIVLFGAELTYAYLRCFNKDISPNKLAEWNEGCDPVHPSQKEPD